jgi:hypothetical protein
MGHVSKHYAHRDVLSFTLIRCEKPGMSQWPQARDFDSLVCRSHRRMQWILYRALKRITTDRQLREQFGVNGRRRILENFTLRKMIRRNEELYHRLLTKHDRPL